MLVRSNPGAPADQHSEFSALLTLPNCHKRTVAHTGAINRVAKLARHHALARRRTGKFMGRSRAANFGRPASTGRPTISTAQVLMP